MFLKCNYDQLLRCVKSFNGFPLHWNFSSPPTHHSHPRLRSTHVLFPLPRLLPPLSLTLSLPPSPLHITRLTYPHLKGLHWNITFFLEASHKIPEQVYSSDNCFHNLCLICNSLDLGHYPHTISYMRAGPCLSFLKKFTPYIFIEHLLYAKQYVLNCSLIYP